ncbi:MAG: apolipoprotein N-acyltransferase [Candidatus Omnitrophica bacterium]|nr:apolipoprotein N-acyltransferase [Candidatus Omnitrophota bacterium]
MSQLILPILAAGLLSFSFSSFNLWFFAWFGFIPLFIALEKKNLLQSFIIGYICGVFFWSLTLYWLIHVTLLGQVVLILYLAFYFALFACVLYLSRSFNRGLFLFFIACAWVLLEYLRSYLFTGFPWALTGFSQYKNLPVIQIADITGSWGVSFLVVLTNLVFYLALRRRLRKGPFLMYACILLLSLVYGFYKLSHKPGQSCDRDLLSISVIQGNIPQDLKWDKQAAGGILNKYIGLAESAAGDNPDLIIWPEASVPALWGQEGADTQFKQVFLLAARLKTALLVGTVSRFGQEYFNSALFIDDAGRPQEIYNKLHLVPFGEYIPFKETFPFLQTIAPIGDIEPGNEYTVFSHPAAFSVLICFEDLFPELSREFVKRGANFLVNITNDAWYKRGSAPYQHFAASVFRAVENRIYLVRAANTGISGFVDPFGRVSAIVRDAAGKDIFVEGYRSRKACIGEARRTIYNRYGDFFVLLCLIFEIGVIIPFFKKR